MLSCGQGPAQGEHDIATVVGLCSQQLWQAATSPVLPQNIWLPYASIVPHAESPALLCVALGGADGAERLHSSFWWGASAPLRLWKSSQDPVVPHRPQHVLGAVRAKGAGLWQMTLTFYEPYPPAYLSGSILLRVMVTRNEKLASPGLSDYLYASV